MRKGRSAGLTLVGFWLAASLEAATVSIGVVNPTGVQFRYALTGSATAIAAVTISVGDSLSWDSTNSGIHPLYLYDGTTCLENGLNPASGLIVTFANPGTYFFHCGNHATGCAPNNFTCAATGCGGMACSVIVNGAAFSATSTPSFTLSPTPSSTASWTSTFTQTATFTPTSSPAMTATFTLTLSPTGMVTLTPTFSQTPSATFSRTTTPTASETFSLTPTSSRTLETTTTFTPTLSPTMTATSTLTPVLMRTSTVTPTLSPTPSFSATNTASSTSTFTPTATLPPDWSPTVTATNPTPSPTPSTIASATLTWTPAATFTSLPTTTPSSGAAWFPPLAASEVEIYPNPSNGDQSVHAAFQLLENGEARLQIFTTAFRKIRDENLGLLPQGYRTEILPLVDREGTPLANGIYYVVVVQGRERRIGKWMVLR